MANVSAIACAGAAAGYQNSGVAETGGATCVCDTVITQLARCTDGAQHWIAADVVPTPPDGVVQIGGVCYTVVGLVETGQGTEVSGSASGYYDCQACADSAETPECCDPSIIQCRGYTVEAVAAEFDVDLFDEENSVDEEWSWTGPLPTIDPGGFGCEVDSDLVTVFNEGGSSYLSVSAYWQASGRALGTSISPIIATGGPGYSVSDYIFVAQCQINYEFGAFVYLYFGIRADGTTGWACRAPNAASPTVSVTITGASSCRNQLTAVFSYSFQRGGGPNRLVTGSGTVSYELPGIIGCREATAAAMTATAPLDPAVAATLDLQARGGGCRGCGQ